ncbi:MAG: ABC transporter substrate-binding protein [Candidatus Rokubacteria bacterium]|nr:ABC transporter substrate-binding protein [Candidatus Rokubacteria bacterium]MBI2553501.1 ABC transporter substrate-binding protein [Candidatus Rokubacteria bacterium]
MIALLVFLQASLTIAVSSPYTSPEYLPLRVAEAEGYFVQERLQVSLRTTRAEAGAAEALAKGEADVAASSLEAALRHGAVGGRPPRLVFGLTAAPPVALLVPVAHRETIRRFEDLVGKRVAVTSPGAPEHPLLFALLERHQIKPTQLSLLSLGERGLAAALEAGEVHAGLLPDPWASRLVEEGKATVLADFRRRDEAARWLGGPTVHAALFVRADRQPKASDLTALARALLRAARRVETAPSEELLTRLPTRVVGLKEDFVARLEGAREIYLPGGWVRYETLQLSVAQIRNRAPFPKGVTVPRRPADLLLLDPLKSLLEPN